jgi:hypothetical protein
MSATPFHKILEDNFAAYPYLYMDVCMSVPGSSLSRYRGYKVCEEYDAIRTIREMIRG